MVDGSPTGSPTDLAGHRGAMSLHANYWLSGEAGPPAQARAGPAAGVHLPHAGPGEGRGGRPRTGRPGPRPRPRSSVAPTRSARPTRSRPTSSSSSTARRPTASSWCRPGSTTPSSHPGDQRGARLALGLDDRPTVLFVGRIQPLKGLAVAVEALALSEHTGGPAGGRRRTQRDPTARPSGTGSAKLVASTWDSAIGCGSSLPSPTTCCPPTTGPPTWSSCRAGPSPSAWSPSRPRPAASRWWPPRSAACAPSCDDGATGLPRRGPRPADFAGPDRRAARPIPIERRAWAPPRRRVDPTTPGPATAGRLRRLYADLAGPQPSSSARDPDRPVAVRMADDHRDRSSIALEALHRRVAGPSRWPTTRRSTRSSATPSPASAAGSCALLGEEKSVFSVWFHLRQRTLHVETYVMPAPEENAGALYEHLLRRNLKLYGHGVRHRGGGGDLPGRPESRTPRSTRPSSTGCWARPTPYVEQCFRPAMRIGFASRFKG